MQESPGRRIMRSINIDIDSVHFLSHDEVVKFASSAFLKDYIDQMVAKLGDINKDKITILDERKHVSYTHLGNCSGQLFCPIR